MDRTNKSMELTQKLLQYFTLPFAYHKCQWVADSERGNREENQDNYLVIIPEGRATYLQQQKEVDTKLSSWPIHSFRLAVADGMGGHENGRQIAEELIQKLQYISPQKNPQQLRESIYALHKKLWNKYSQTSLKSPGTTLVMADIKDNGEVMIANVGDSRAYLWRNKQWQQLTYDQNLSEYDWRDNELEVDDNYQLNHKSHQIAQAMGYGSYGLLRNKYGHRALQLNPKLRLDLADDLATNKQHPDIFKLHLQKGDALLLATDGLWSIEKDTQPLNIPHPADITNKADLRTFLGKVQNNGSSDNMTAVMLWSEPK